MALLDLKAIRPRLLVTFAERIQPAHTAVLVVDVQNDYAAQGGATDKRVGSVANTRKIVQPLQGLLAAARDAGATIVYVEMTLDADLRLMSDIAYLRRRKRWGDIPVCVKGTWGQEVIAEVAPHAGDFEVAKTRSSGFVGTNLDILLRGQGIRTVLVTGLVTNGCAGATARDALHHDYYTVVVRDCVAANDPQVHERALLDLEGHLELEDSVVDSQRIIEGWSAMAPGC